MTCPSCGAMILQSGTLHDDDCPERSNFIIDRDTGDEDAPLKNESRRCRCGRPFVTSIDSPPSTRCAVCETNRPRPVDPNVKRGR